MTQKSSRDWPSGQQGGEDARHPLASPLFAQLHGLPPLLVQTGGAELLVETARLWRSLGFFNERAGGRFCINAVTGPDEYNTVVNNNLFTNLMARENLMFAVEIVGWMKEHFPDHYQRLSTKIELEPEEELALAGYVFDSDTDSEVVAHLVHQRMAQGDDLLAAVQATVGRLRGAYAIAVISDLEPGVVVGARAGSLFWIDPTTYNSSNPPNNVKISEGMIRSATDNADAAAFYTKWLKDVAADQQAHRPGKGEAPVG